MVTSPHPPANGFVRSMRKVYNPVGFAKGYNFVLWFIFGGALLGFALARTPFLNFYGVFCDEGAAPGECWYYLRGRNHEKIGIILHLVTIIPASILVLFQFIPVIRHKLILFHRINGYLVILLSLLGTAGALMIARHAFGGGIETQMAMGLLAIMFVVSMVMAYVNVKRLQIEEHRAWMLRGWFYAGTIITVRLIMILTAMIISTQDGYYAARPCGQVDYIFKGNQSKTLASFPECGTYYSGQNLNQHTLIRADINNGGAAGASAALGLSFGPAAWLALAIHAIGIEIYLKLTPAEHDRLRNISYQRQRDAGMKNPGRAGLTVDRFGDAERWVPSGERGAGSEASVVGKAGSSSNV
ncbi:uncharacterized protein DNG_04438 [Cephalotrichum gorgonifer]|uniref:Microtubule associated protein n=1 Tax=Cephalotrichum gorgonifer TaxID=2041049 RepID=A0AAE8MYR6_9PEZI|nr:uncharacterized protein DNG_04438 [Cephalotrichum gorgonifer]